jgi:hypothetical protein
MNALDQQVLGRDQPLAEDGTFGIQPRCEPAALEHREEPELTQL